VRLDYINLILDGPGMGAISYAQEALPVVGTTGDDQDVGSLPGGGSGDFRKFDIVANRNYNPCRSWSRILRAVIYPRAVGRTSAGATLRALRLKPWSTVCAPPLSCALPCVCSGEIPHQRQLFPASDAGWLPRSILRKVPSGASHDARSSLLE
jgi:hypothetical protein